MLIRRFIITVSCLLVLAVAGVSGTLAQDEATCTALVQSAIDLTTAQCASAAPNSACYGHASVIGSFLVETQPGVFEKQPDSSGFAQPGDAAELLLTEAVVTGPLNMTASPATWGLSVMNVQAGLPTDVLRANGGKGVMYILLGGVEVENAVAPEDTLIIPEEPLAVSTIGAADMRMSPVAFDTPTASNVLGRVPGETALTADAVTADGEWVRVLYGGQSGWISRATLQPAADLSSLPLVGPDSFTPMQSFYFHNEADSTVCANVPSLLVVQGPPNVPVYLRVQGANIRIESTAIFRTLPGTDFFEIITLFGMVTIFPDTVNQLYVPPGFVVRLQLSAPSDLGIQGDADDRNVVSVVGTIRPLTPEELELLEILRLLPINLLHYLIELPRYVLASGIGDVLEQLIFDNPAALSITQLLCQNERLPEEVCAILGL